jgi:hypothetical protein
VRDAVATRDGTAGMEHEDGRPQTAPVVITAGLPFLTGGVTSKARGSLPIPDPRAVHP